MPASKRRGGCGGENPTPKTTPECWLAISEELTDLQLCMEMLEGAGYGADPVAAADQRAAKLLRWRERLDNNKPGRNREGGKRNDPQTV